ncbi:rab guanine nucleotide exchange factor S2 [Nowakowskiella sp. JEL0078]|nr:rab guanine nucleotide exchange factor S2 [Nowakowskiella sp. JEL0078]
MSTTLPNTTTSHNRASTISRSDISPILPNLTLPNFPNNANSENLEIEDPADRIASLKDRLKSLSAKHTTKKTSSASLSSSGSFSDLLVPSNSSNSSLPNISVDIQDTTYISQTPPADVLVSGTPNYKQPDRDCPCQQVIGTTTESTTCKLCLGALKPLVDLQTMRDKLLDDLERARQRHVVFTKREDETIREMTRLRDLLDEKEGFLSSKVIELEKTKTDLHNMGEKLMDAVEARAELQASKEAVQDELEDLTKLLFEEANNLVAKEARLRYEHEKREKNLEKQLIDTNHQLKMEQEQLKELRSKLEHQQLLRVENANGTNLNNEDNFNYKALELKHHKSQENMLMNLQDTIDPLLLTDFENFLQQASIVKISKIHSLPFMKNALEDDLEPCLRFGGNPKTSSTKLIDAIVRNSCFVEELTPTQIAAMQAQRAGAPSNTSVQIPISPYEYQLKKESSDMDTWGTKLPPTFALFNKTVMERFTRWGTSTPVVTSTLNPGCSTCGRLGLCRYQFRVSDQKDDICCPMCTHCRDRLVAVCEFYNFVRHVRQGLYASRIVGELFVEVMALKRKMFYARIGCSHPTMFNERGWDRLKTLQPVTPLLVQRPFEVDKRVEDEIVKEIILESPTTDSVASLSSF